MSNKVIFIGAFLVLAALSVFGITSGESSNTTQAAESKIKIFHGALGTDASRQEFEDKLNKWLSDNNGQIFPTNLQQSNLGKFSTQTTFLYKTVQNGPIIRAKIFTGSPSENEGFQNMEKRMNDWLKETKAIRFMITQSSSDNHRLDMIVWYELKN